jgi:uncharacterized metal-binding protein YceD (DUF177 family)
MDVLNRYEIAWKSLKIGTYHYDFKVDEELFKAYDSTEIKGGDLAVSVDLDRQETLLTLQIAIEGTVVTVCDRCLEDCRLPIAYKGTLYVRFAEETPDFDGEVMWISPAETHLSLAQYIYESIILSLPYQRVHPEGECDADMLSRFRIISEREFSEIERKAEGGDASSSLGGEALEALNSLKKQLTDTEKKN